MKDWNGRFWSLWGAVDLLPMGSKVVAVMPGLINPFPESAELEITGRNTGRIAAAPGFSSHGEGIRCTRAKSGKITELWLGGSKLLPAAKVAREMETRYGRKPAREGKRR